MCYPSLSRCSLDIYVLVTQTFWGCFKSPWILLTDYNVMCGYLLSHKIVNWSFVPFWFNRNYTLHVEIFLVVVFPFRPRCRETIQACHWQSSHNLQALAGKSTHNSKVQQEVWYLRGNLQEYQATNGGQTCCVASSQFSCRTQGLFLSGCSRKFQFSTSFKELVLSKWHVFLWNVEWNWFLIDDFFFRVNFF